MNNPIRELILAKIRGVYAKYEESNSITHAATKGALREQALTEFITGVLPNKFLVKSGFISHSKSSSISPQIDLIVADKDPMPNFSLNDMTSIIPIESALMTTEIKSRLDKVALEQLVKQREVINNLEFDFIMNITCSHPLQIPQIAVASTIVSFDSQLSIEELKTWFGKMNDLMSICVIGKYCISRLSQPHGLTVIKNEGKHEETMFYIGKLYQLLNELKKMRNYLEPNWDNYLQDIIQTSSTASLKIEKK